MLSIFCAPARYVQGRNATEELGFEMTKLGLEGPVFIVAGKSARKLLDDTWQRTFMAAGLKYVVHDFGGECSREEIELAKKAAQAANAQVVIGAGGGKVPGYVQGGGLRTEQARGQLSNRGLQ